MEKRDLIENHIKQLDILLKQTSLARGFDAFVVAFDKFVAEEEQKEIMDELVKEVKENA